MTALKVNRLHTVYATQAYIFQWYLSQFNVNSMGFHFTIWSNVYEWRKLTRDERCLYYTCLNDAPTERCRGVFGKTHDTSTELGKMHRKDTRNPKVPSLTRSAPCLVTHTGINERFENNIYPSPIKFKDVHKHFYKWTIFFFPIANSQFS